MKIGTPGFSGERLKAGREARGINASALADVIGVTRATMSQYEHGRQSPSPDALRRLSEALNLPIQWFLRPLREVPVGTVFYRSLQSATNSARLRAERRFQWLKELVGIVQQRVRIPAVNLPELDIPSDPQLISDAQIEEVATATRAFWNLKDGPIGNVVWLLENAGIVVSRFELYDQSLDAFSEIDATTSRPYIVLGSDKESAARSRFDAAHELGHLILHRGITSSLIENKEVHKLLEKQAHRFASAFLLPASSFAYELRDTSLQGLLGLKERWRVSIASMIYRASDLRLITPEQVDRLRKNYSRRGWRTREPLDEALVPEKPCILGKAIEMLISKGVMSPTEFSFVLSLPNKDIEQLAGLANGYLCGSGRVLDLEEEIQEEPRIVRFPS